jgi:hypothetical protein
MRSSTETDPRLRAERWAGDGPTVQTSQIEATEDAGADARARMRRAGSPTDAGVAPATWQDIKSRFVDDPAGAIAAAEDLVRQAVEQQIRALNAEAAALYARDAGDEAPSTEALRTRLIEYQSYYERLARPRT